MKYEIKFIHPLPLLFNASRIFVVLGFFLSILTFFVFPNPGMMGVAWWQKVVGALIFTLAYTLIISIIVTVIALLYNFYAGRFKGVTLHLEQSE